MLHMSCTNPDPCVHRSRHCETNEAQGEKKAPPSSCTAAQHKRGRRWKPASTWSCARLTEIEKQSAREPAQTHAATGPARNDTLWKRLADRRHGMWLTALINSRPLAAVAPARESGVSQCASRAPEVSAGAATGHRIAGKAHLAKDTKEPQDTTTDCTSKPSPFLLISSRPGRAMTPPLPSWRMRRPRQAARRRNSWRPRRSQRRCTCSRRT